MLLLQAVFSPSAYVGPISLDFSKSTLLLNEMGGHSLAFLSSQQLKITLYLVFTECIHC